LVFTSTGDTGYNPGPNVYPADSNVECHLTAIGTGRVDCYRGASNEPLKIKYQVVTWGRTFEQGGVSVQHLLGAFASGETSKSVALTTAVDPAHSFVLFSSLSSNTPPDTLNGAAHFATATLNAAGNAVDLRRTVATATLAYSLQVVQFAGADVTRGSLTALTGGLNIYNVPVDTARSILLFSAQLSGSNDDANICKRLIRGRLSSQGGGQLRFSRGSYPDGGYRPECADSEIDRLEWEKITFTGYAAGAVQTASPVTLDGGVSSVSWPLGTTVAPHKSIVLFSGQGPGGQCSGETSWVGADSAAADNTGIAHSAATINTGGTAVTVERALNVDVANFSPYVLQFEP
jgi:hypothetical protein